MRCDALQYSTLLFETLQYQAIQYSPVQSSPLHYTAIAVEDNATTLSLLAWSIRQAGLARGRDSHLHRLARVFQVDADQLGHELGKLFPVAARLRIDRGLSNLAAWRVAIATTERARSSYTLLALGPVLVRYGAWTVSTSGVEQSFAIRRWVVSKLKKSVSPQTEQDRLTITCHTLADPSELTAICEGAQAVWRQLYGRPHAFARRIRGSNRPCKRLDVVGTLHESTWLKRRRTSTQNVVDAHASSSASCSIEDRFEAARKASLPVWSDRHDKEVTFQAAHRHLRALDATNRGHLLDEEVTPEMAALATARKKHVASLDAGSARAAARLAAEAAPKPPAPLSTWTVHVDPGLRADSILQASLHELGCNQAEQFFFNDVFVVPDVVHPPMSVRWCASIAGSRVSDPEFIRSRGTHGICAKYNPSLRMKRFVWLSAAFRTAYPGIASILDAFCSLNVGWKPIPDLRGYLLRERMRSTLRSNLIGLVVQADITNQPALQHIRGICLRPSDLLSTLSTLDKVSTIVNV